MIPETKIDNLNAGDKEQIMTIAHWYFEEWNTPIAKTFTRLANQSNGDVLFQLVATRGNKLIATVGLGNKVNLTKTHERFSNLKPWITLMYTEKNFRNQGVGKSLLAEIERQAKELELNELFVYTFTAESLYSQYGWKEIERVNYKGHDTVIMKKEI